MSELQRRDRAPFRVRDVRIDVERLLINPRRLMDTGAIEILDAGALRIERLTIRQADVDEFLRGQPAGAALAIHLRDGRADVALRRFRASARVSLLPGAGGAPFTVKVDDFELGSIPVPALLVDWVVRHFDPTPRLRNLPVPVSLGTIRINPGRVEVGSPDGG